ncbi:hypothetical protein [Geoalkalibacter subterraneus]|uniref:hypothetical protein n=1 Tax=Geoalkalibacter subterraneus TaxID=483547 RepID=UPI001F47DBAE
MRRANEVNVLDLPILAVDVELGALVLADLAPGINGLLLLVEVAAATVARPVSILHTG